MAYLTDKEKRLLFSALTREKKVCVEVDKECYRETYEDTLESVVKNLEKKFYYDRFEKEIRAKAIDEFAERLKSDEFQKYDLDMVFETSRDLSYSNCVNAFCEYVNKIAEEMRGGENERN